MGKLQEMLMLQDELDQNVILVCGIKPNQLDKSMALMQEVCEIQSALHYKWWKGQKYLDSYNSEEVKEELIDVLHFWLSLCNDLNMTEEEIYNIYLKKNIVNHERLEKVVIEREE